MDGGAAISIIPLQPSAAGVSSSLRNCCSCVYHPAHSRARTECETAHLHDRALGVMCLASAERPPNHLGSTRRRRLLCAGGRSIAVDARGAGAPTPGRGKVSAAEQGHAHPV
jgi:hypothetical protein